MYTADPRRFHDAYGDHLGIRTPRLPRQRPARGRRAR